MKKKSGSLSKAMGMLPQCNFYWQLLSLLYSTQGACDTKTLFCRQFGNIHVDSLSC